ncbi:TIGR02099 family protein [Neiella marina]|uniref:TIGR02099 family protein n=1 Tax=Neiella holothuriorum TaxID=2870530 RepID=A0ABS7EAU0_9GAMM|nr:YhdP family protein [Neiella holothuriorum]MBW8189456.1 TIGR02099 family protein [Neiella holothuriorum]
MTIGRICQSAFYYLWLLLAIIVIIAALAVSSLRLLVPHAHHIKQPIVDWFLDSYQMELDYQQLDLSWQRFGLYLALTNVNIEPLEGEPDRIKGIEKLSMRIDPFASLMAGAARFGDIRLNGVELDISAMEGGTTEEPLESPMQQLMLELVTSRFEAFEVTDFTIHLGADEELPSLHIPYLVWSNRNDKHQGEGRIRVSHSAEESLQFIVKLTGNEKRPKNIKGQLYLNVKNLAPHQFAQGYLGEEVTLTNSLLNFESWINFGWDSVDHAVIQLQQNSLDWQLALEQHGDPHQIQVERGYLVFDASGDEWRLFSNDLDVHTNGQLWHDLNLKIWQKEDVIKSSIEYVDLSLIAPLLEWIPQRWELPIPQQLPLKGAVQRLRTEFRDEESWQLTADFNDVGWPQLANMPGTEMVNGAIYLNQDLLQLNLTAPAQVISTGDLFYQNIELEWFEGFLQATRRDWGWQFEVPNLSLRATDLSAEVSAKGRFGPDLPAELYLYGELDLANAGHADYYFPLKAMGKNLAGYLSDSLLAGQAEQAQILWHGPLTNFPYQDGSGLFQAWIPLRDSTFKFSPDWPALEPLDLDLLFENSDLTMTARKARLYDVHVDDLVAKIPGLKGDSVLAIDGKITGSATSVRTVMNDSMLADSVGNSLELLDLKGPVWGPLSLAIPLDKPSQVEVSGFVQLEQAELTIPGTQSHIISDVDARVTYQQQRFEINDLTGNYHGLPVQVSVVGDQQADHYLVEGAVTANWQAQALKKLPGFWVPGLSGSMQTKATVATQIDQQGATTEIVIDSDLASMAIDLPVPFSKVAGNALNLQGRIDISADNQFDMAFELADYGVLRWLQDLAQTGSEPRIWVGVSAEQPAELDVGLQVDVNRPEVDINQWLDAFAGGLATDDLGTEGGIDHAVVADRPVTDLIDTDVTEDAAEKSQYADIGSLPFDRGTWQFDRISAGNWYLDKAKVTLTKTPLGWQAEAQGEGIEGVARYDVLDRPLLDIKLEHLVVQQVVADEQAPTAASEPRPDVVPATAEQLAAIPNLDVACSSCQVAGFDLGSVRLASYVLPEQGVWRVEEAWLRNPHGAIELESFEWLVEEGLSRTEFVGKLETEDFGKYVESFKGSSESPIKDSTGKGTLKFSWPGAPYQLDVRTLEGHFEWELGAGHVAELSDKGARVFTLLSIDSLVRKMRLDFSDVFDKGLHYNSFEGDFVVEDGYVNSEQLVMDGVAGDMFINGRTNLMTRELDYDVVFNPNLTGSLPLLSALTFNPITGVYVLALSAVIKPAMEVVTQVRFKVSGTTAEPIVEEVSRSRKELELQQPPAEPEPADEVVDSEAPAKEAEAESTSPAVSSSASQPAVIEQTEPLMPELPPEQPITVGGDANNDGG